MCRFLCAEVTFLASGSLKVIRSGSVW